MLGNIQITQVLCVVMDQGTERWVVDFPMDAVAGARRTLGRPKTGGVPSKPPATVLLSVPSVFWEFGSFYQRHCVTSYALSRQPFFFTSMSLRRLPRGTRKQNIAFQMFLQLQTLRRHVSRLVAAGMFLSAGPHFLNLCWRDCRGGIFSYLETLFQGGIATFVLQGRPPLVLRDTLHWPRRHHSSSRGGGGGGREADFWGLFCRPGMMDRIGKNTYNF